MSRLPAVQSDFSKLNDMLFNAVRAKLLTTSVALKIYDRLENAQPAEAVAQNVNGDPENTGLMLDALCACGLLSKQAGAYRNTALASDFLVSGKATYLGAWLQQADASYKHCLDNFGDVVIHGADSANPDAHMNSEAYCEHYTESHAASSLGGIGRGIAEHISALPGFGDCRRLLDLGGGPGINAMAVLEANDALRATLFDRPEIVRMAREYAKTWGFDHRMEVLGGDYLQDDFGQGYDVIMATDTLYYAGDQIDLVTAKCRQALAPGGFLVGVHAVLTDERTQPESLVVGILCESLMGQGSLPDQGFLAASMARCGLQKISSRMINVGGSLLEMNVAYKL